MNPNFFGLLLIEIQKIEKELDQLMKSEPINETLVVYCQGKLDGLNRAKQLTKRE